MQLFPRFMLFLPKNKQRIATLQAGLFFFWVGMIGVLATFSGLKAQDTQTLDSLLPAQKTQKLENLTLQACVAYAVKNHLSVQNAMIDNQIAKARVGQVRSIGLPQVKASLNVIDNFKIPVNFLPAQFLNPNAEPNTFVPVTFQPQYIGQAKVELQQLIFSGSYFLGLKAASTYTQLTEKSITQSQIQVAENVSKAFYSVLINEQRYTLLEENLRSLDSLYAQTQALYQNGFVEKIDVDRIRVSVNNLKMEKENFRRLIDLSKELLKFQMGLRPEDVLTIQGKIEDVQLQNVDLETAVDPTKRIEYSLLQTQLALNDLQIREYKVRYLPTLAFFANYGSNMGSPNVKDALLPLFTDRWIGNGAFGLSLNIPIFDGLEKMYLIQQGKLERKKTLNQMSEFERATLLQANQAKLNLKNSLDKLAFQRENMELAKEIFRVTKVKYQEGVGSNLEVINAETAYKEAETNYYAALYDAIIAKIDLEKAKGTLF
jgi:outer membrane protein TolC